MNEYGRVSTDMPQWMLSLKEICEAAMADDKILIFVELARKTPRLLEWYFQNFEEFGTFINIKQIKVVQITEHALPVFDWGKKPMQTFSVVVIDDFMVYGNSVELVTENIFYQTGIKPYVLALGRSTNEMAFPFATKLLDCAAFTEEKIPEFVTRNARRILWLNRSIDMEYTILKCSLQQNEVKADFIRNLLYEKLNSSFSDTAKFQVYKTIHNLILHSDSESEGENKDCSNVTVLLKEATRIALQNNDFSKLRFYVSDTEISLVSYVPNIIFEDSLSADCNLFSGTVFETVWRKVCEKIDRQTVSSDAEQLVKKDYPYMKMFFRSNYEERKMQSKVIWANYLASFGNVLLLNHEIETFIKELSDSAGMVSPLSFSLDGCDLQLLLGDEAFVSQIKEDLTNILYINRDALLSESLIFPRCVNVDDDVASSSLIPESYAEEYYQQNKIGAYFSANVREALSHIFSNMHYKIGISGGSDWDKQQMLRQRVGECYNSLRNELVNFFPEEEDLILEIHKWIDEKIDMGIVVPKYEKNTDWRGRTYWKRYFRAGENEDTYIKLARLCMYYTREELVKQQGPDWENATFTRDFFVESVFEPHILKLYDKYPDQIPLDDFKERVEEAVSTGNVIKNLWNYLTNGIAFMADSLIGETRYRYWSGHITGLLNSGHALVKED